MLVGTRSVLQELKKATEKADFDQDLLQLNPLMDEATRTKNELQTHPEYLRFLVHKENTSLLQKSSEGSDSISSSYLFVSKQVAETIRQKENNIKEEIEKRIKSQKERMEQEYKAQAKLKRKEHKKVITDLTFEHLKDISSLNSQLESMNAQLEAVQEENKELHGKLEDMQEQLKKSQLSLGEFIKIYRAVKGSYVHVNGEFLLSLDMKDERDQILIAVLSQ